MKNTTYLDRFLPWALVALGGVHATLPASEPTSSRRTQERTAASRPVPPDAAEALPERSVIVAVQRSAADAAPVGPTVARAVGSGVAAPSRYGPAAPLAHLPPGRLAEEGASRPVHAHRAGAAEDPHRHAFRPAGPVNARTATSLTAREVLESQGVSPLQRGLRDWFSLLDPEAGAPRRLDRRSQGRARVGVASEQRGRPTLAAPHAPTPAIADQARREQPPSGESKVVDRGPAAARDR